MDVTIHGDDWSQTFYWPDALSDAKIIIIIKANLELPTTFFIYQVIELFSTSSKQIIYSE